MLTEVDIRSLHFVSAPRSGPRRSAWCPSPRCSTPVDPLDPDAVREHACLVSDMIAAGLRARGA